MTSIRKGIPHLFPTRTNKGNLSPSISENELSMLLNTNELVLDNITEKTDGLLLMLGYDDNGFFTKYSGSGDMKARKGNDHIIRATERNNSLSAANAFSIFHDILSDNKKLIQFLKEYKKINLRGEMFNLNFCTPCSKYKDHVKFINTSYNSKLMGTYGMYILHTSLEDNRNINPDDFKMLSNSDIIFDTDILDIQIKIDLSDINYISTGQQLHEYILEKLPTQYKWGMETEGYVIHHPAVRFKIISDRFKEEKKNGRQFINR